MAYIKHYWNEKEKRADRAKKWTQLMEHRYPKEIEGSAARTREYSGPFSNDIALSLKVSNPDRMPEISVIDAGVTDAIVSEHRMLGGGGPMAVLNFASFKEPGGMFLAGSRAQEECLCHTSFLYNVLRRKTSFYEWNRKHLNRALYQDRLLYTPDVLFFENGSPDFHAVGIPCDVITCAAPNKSAAQRNCYVSDEENHKALEKRIRFLLQAAQMHTADVVILGAYGCGVFGQDPTEVAEIFRDELRGTLFSKAVFPIPRKVGDGNYEAFAKVFGKDGGR